MDSKIKVGVLVIVAVFLISILGLAVHNCLTLEVTVPPGHTLCSKDPDCLEGQHCGFVDGYTAAVCVGTPTSDKLNLQ